MKLGKAPAKHDDRTLKLGSILAAAYTPPPAFDNDAGKNIPTPMFANDSYGDCVIAGRAHMTLRFEDSEQGCVIAIHDGDVIREYDKESGGMDSGLNMLDSLKCWRKGWKAAGRQYNIHAFAALDPTVTHEVMASIALLSGAYVGVALPDNWEDQFLGGSWSDASMPPNPANGHCIYIPTYDTGGFTCITWGKRLPMTWAFFEAYCDEAFAICDDRDKWLKHDPLNVAVLDKLLAEVEAA